MLFRVIIERTSDNLDTFNAILHSAAVHGTCHQFSVSKLNRKCTTVTLFADEPVYVHNVGLITMTTEGEPRSTCQSDGPLYYKKIVIDTDDKKATKEWIEKSVEDFQTFQSTFPRKNDEIFILTWDEYWSNEYSVPLRQSLYLPGETLKDIQDDLELFYASRDDYTALEIPWTRTYMLHGLPGTGKTTLVHTLASRLKKDIAIIDFSSRESDDEGIRRAMYKLPKDTILVMEDIDSLFKERKTEDTNVTFSGLLNILDGVVKNSGLVVFMTTNFLNNMNDVALKRRVDYYLKFDTMKPDQIEIMFNRFYPNQVRQVLTNVGQR